MLGSNAFFFPREQRIIPRSGSKSARDDDKDLLDGIDSWLGSSMIQVT